MNNGILPGNSAPKRFDPDESYYTGYWGPYRQVSGIENPGEIGMQLTLNPGSALFTIPPFLPPNSAQPNLEQPTEWVVIANELPFDVEAFEIHPRGSLSVNGNSIVITMEVAYGAVGKETTVLTGFGYGPRQAGTSGAGVADVIGPFPIRIPAGQRVVMRLVYYATSNSSAAAVTTGLFQPFFHRRYPRPGTKGLTIPLGNPNFAPRLPSVASNTDSAWADVGTVPFDTNWVVPCPFIGSSLNAYSIGMMVFDYAYVDGAGSEVVIIDNFAVEANNAEWQWSQPRPYPVNLPAGTLIRARGKYDAVTTSHATSVVPAITCIGVEDVDPARRPGQSALLG